MAFAKATELVLTNPDLRRKMGALGRAKVEECFSIQQHVSQIRELFDVVLNSDGKTLARHRRGISA